MIDLLTENYCEITLSYYMQCFVSMQNSKNMSGGFSVKIRKMFDGFGNFFLIG